MSFASSAEISKLAKANIDVQHLTKAVNKYKTIQNRYPTNEEGLSILANCEQANEDCLIRRLPKDPWGNDYQYLYPGKKNIGGFDIWSYGEDGTNGGVGMNADCGNWRSDKCHEPSVEFGIRVETTLAMALVGLCLGLPPYIARSIQLTLKTKNLRNSLTGFHSYVLIYLIAVFVLVGQLVIHL